MLTDPAGGVRTGLFPGDGLGIVTARVLVLLEHVADEAVPEVVAQLDAGGDVDSVLEVLAGVGLRSLGSFAVVADEGSAARVIVRGDARVRIAGREIDGAGLKTWNEQVVTEWTTIELALGAIAEPPSVFAVDNGVVPAAGLVRPNVALAGSSPPAARAPSHPVVLGAHGEPSPEPVAGPEPLRESTLIPEPMPEPLPESEPQREAEPEPGVAADPAHTLVVGELDTRTAAPDPEPSGAPSSPYDELYGHTVMRSVQAAAMQAPEAPEPEPPADAPRVPLVAAVPSADPSPWAAEAASLGLGDHDGHTISLARLRELQREEAGGSPAAGVAALGDHDGHTMSLAQLRSMQQDSAQPGIVASAPPAAAPAGPTVQALVCPGGHPNPTHASACARCGAELPTAPVTVPRPSLGRFRLSTGETVELDRPVVIGRNPRIEGRMTGELPKVVRLDQFQGISRSHAMIRLEGWQVLVVDLGSANHTTVTLPGRPPRRLHADEPMLLADGAEIDLGGEVTATYDAGV